MKTINTAPVMMKLRRVLTTSPTPYVADPANNAMVAGMMMNKLSKGNNPNP